MTLVITTVLQGSYHRIRIKIHIIKPYQRATIKSQTPSVRGDIKIHWLQPPNSAASCSQIIEEKLYITDKCSILAEASGYEF